MPFPPDEQQKSDLKAEKVEVVEQKCRLAPLKMRFVYNLAAQEEYEEFPLSQPCEKHFFYEVFQTRKEEYRENAFAAPASAATSSVSQDLSRIPSPFPKPLRHGCVIFGDCPIWQKPVLENTPTLSRCGVKWDICGSYFHFDCAGLEHAPKFGSWACKYHHL